MDRAKIFFGHLAHPEAVYTAQQCASSTGKHQDSDDDIVIVSALRTPICKSKRGGLKVDMLNLIYILRKTD